MAEYFDITEVDLERTAQRLADIFGGPLEGAVMGRTRLRDAVVEHLRCSELEGERVVDTMVGRGFLTLEHRPDGSECWLITAGNR